MYEITKVINNNIVCSIDSNGKEIILRGLGIGFQKKKRDCIDKEKVEKVYRIADKEVSSKLQELLEEIPLEYVSTCTDIIDYAKQSLTRRLNDNIYITLTDHISFAIERKNQNLEYKNALLSEIKSFYPKEYEIGLNAVEIIKERLSVELSCDEAAFIALHIVNAELDTDMCNMVSITEMIQSIIEIVECYYKKELKKDTLHFDRFITHLKYFGQRVFQNKITKDDDMTFQKMVREHFVKEYECAEQIRNFVEETYHKRITEEEMIFLTVHLRRIITES
ncbi:BglG family transcription antiterminator LicT [Velocimicrobium porci]|uniref:PRD domain-containing protein n=1 Tax=Velocimicrobium porci TaxID=2606634 RepID=A0A6L5XZ34_9FIRM|nr:PRD domain-containing protein [Velocimicrobium porci]MSS63468.1 PRD domain-containing protein [Velocimicrobium porci]